MEHRRHLDFLCVREKSSNDLLGLEFLWPVRWPVLGDALRKHQYLPVSLVEQAGLALVALVTPLLHPKAWNF